jgi:VPDSG-CTERM motif
MTKKNAASLALAAGALLAGIEQSQAVSFNFASINSASIYFNGLGDFEFLPNGLGMSFEVTNGSAAGLDGHITGTYAIGAVTTAFGVSTAPVSGSGTFFIVDGGDTLTADITFANVIQAGVGSTINFTGAVNMSNITYGGSNADLLELYNDGAGINTVTFQFTNVRTLSTLKTSENATSFSGSIESVGVPDGGSSAAMLGLAFVGIGALARRRR